MTLIKWIELILGIIFCILAVLTIRESIRRRKEFEKQEINKGEN